MNGVVDRIGPANNYGAYTTREKNEKSTLQGKSGLRIETPVGSSNFLPKIMTPGREKSKAIVESYYNNLLRNPGNSKTEEKPPKTLRTPRTSKDWFVQTN